MKFANIIALMIIIYFIIYIIKFNDKDVKNKIKGNKKKEIKKKEKKKKRYNNKKKCCKNFIESQFHNDYRDTITAFNNIVPIQKQIFNKSNYAVKNMETDINEVIELIKGFIKKVNKEIKGVSEYINKDSGWDELYQERKIKSGWDKQQENLGLPKSIFNEPAHKSKVKLINIDKIEKQITIEQIRYITHIILQKENVEDQIIVKIAFVFNNKEEEEININIEEIFIIGYLTNNFGSKKTEFYNFEGIEKDGIYDQDEIIKQLNKKYENKQNENISNQILGISPSTINNIAINRLTNKY